MPNNKNFIEIFELVIFVRGSKAENAKQQKFYRNF